MTRHAGAPCILQFSKGVTSFGGGCLLKGSICMDPCPRKLRARGSAGLCDSVPARYSLECSEGPSDQSCLCAGDGVAAGHLSLALPLFLGRMSPKVWAFRARSSLALVAELSAGRRCVLSSGMCGCDQSISCYITVWFFSWRKSLLHVWSVVRAWAAELCAVV